jgi:hypothetical protein
MIAEPRLYKATAADVPAIRELTLRAYAKWVPLTPRKPPPMTADYDLAIVEHRFDCLSIDGVMIGLIETVPQDGDLLIVDVAVDPA